MNKNDNSAGYVYILTNPSFREGKRVRDASIYASKKYRSSFYS